MTQIRGDLDVERFRDALVLCLGLQFDDSKQNFLEEVLRRRLGIIGHGADLYFARLESGDATGEIGALAQELTVPETYFFRNSNQFRAFSDVALPARVAARAGTARLRILSAGCASGEEAYSLAILTREMVDRCWDVSILGADVNPVMVAKAIEAAYSPWALRETPADLQRRWFKPRGREFILDETLRTAVRFEARNLVQDEGHIWQPQSYDVVFFRNVLMYFTREVAKAVIAKVSVALRPGGFLFLGHAETLRGLSSDFHLQHTHDTFYYQRRDCPQSPAGMAAKDARRAETMHSTPPAVEAADTWIDVITRSSERIESLADSPRPHSGVASRPTKPRWDLGFALELLRRERFSEAFETMRRLPSESRVDPDVLLLSAALQTHRGHLTEAEDLCRQLLEIDEFNAGAHYLLALCREGAGDESDATHHDQVAIYLDPSFAMPHLHLGLLARRAGDRATAQQELAQALLLLQREEGSRLLLFGGGFGREALTTLCRTELTRCGGRP
jgi:chemotaxis protein methyltransferase CheR